MSNTRKSKSKTSRRSSEQRKKQPVKGRKLRKVSGSGVFSKNNAGFITEKKNEFF